MEYSVFQDSVTEIQKISEFLELKSDQTLIEEIAEKCEFSNMKKEKDPLEDSSGWKDGKPGMYRKGWCVTFESFSLRAVTRNCRTCQLLHASCNILFIGSIYITRDSCFFMGEITFYSIFELSVFENHGGELVKQLKYC